MEENQFNTQDNPEIKAPKRRGRPPKSESVKPQSSTSDKPKRGRKSVADSTELNFNADSSNADFNNDSVDNVKSLDDAIDIAVKQRRGRRGRTSKSKREDGPKWIDAPVQSQESNSEDNSDDQSQLFVYQDKSDDFAYAKNSNERNDDNDDDIPTSFSTTDDDIEQDNYRNDYNNTTDSQRIQQARDYENAVDDDDDNSNDKNLEITDNRRQNSRQDRDSNNRNQNRNQKRDRNNRFERNQKNRKPQGNNQQDNDQQANQNRQQQGGNRQQNNQKNRQQQQGANARQQQAQQTRQQGNNRQQANQQNRNQQRQKRQSWLQNYSVEGDVINPADLPEWDVILDQSQLDNFLAETFLGKTKADDVPTDNAQIIEENVDAQIIDPSVQSQQSQVQDVQEEVAIEPVEEVIELPQKEIADMNYWELMVNANQTAITQLGLEKAQPKKEEEQVVQTQSDDAEQEVEQPAFQEPTTLKIEGVGEIEILNDFEEIYNSSIKDIQQKYNQLGVEYKMGVSKTKLVCNYLKFALKNKKLVKITGVLDVFEAEFGGAITYASDNFRLKKMSVYVSKMLIEKYALKRGHVLSVLAMPPREDGNENCPIAVAVISVMGDEPQKSRNVVSFTDLVPYYPTRRIILESDFALNADKISMRAVDLLSPIGFGQRALLVAPPRTGKTVLMQGIAKSIRMNEPNAHLMILLVDERPEEVTDFKRNVDAEVIASTFDEDATNHVHAAEMVISKARRMVEYGKDVVILLDSITRLARAYNALMPNGGRTMSGGVEANALQKPKKFFGSARNIEGGGSLTIVGTALIETGSKMDEVIFEEFKGTGNLELVLDRGLSDKRIFPAINIEKSGTRKEELLYHPDEMQKIYSLRRAMKGVPTTDAMEMLAQRLKRVKTNIEFLMGLNR